MKPKKQTMPAAMASITSQKKPIKTWSLVAAHLDWLVTMADRERPSLKKFFATVRNPQDDLIKWGYAHKHGADVTESGYAVLERVEKALRTGAGFFKASCPGCETVYQVTGPGPAYCPCQPKAPFKLVPAIVTEIVNKVLPKKWRARK